MLLAIDIGNSEVTLGVHVDSQWRARWRLRTVVNGTPDEYALLLKGLFREEGIPLGGVRYVGLASVVPPVTDTLVHVVQRHLQADLLVVRPGVRTGLRIRAENPAEVGADLIVNAVAAYERFKDACIIVSLGTATVFTAVSAGRDFLGAAIAPGLRMAARALSEQTAQLPDIQLSAPPVTIGRNTVHAMQSGLVWGYVSLVEGMVARFQEEMRTNARVIATGGLAPLIAPLTSVVEVVDPWLTLEGLRILVERNLRSSR